MDDVILAYSTGSPKIDAIIQGVIGLFEMLFPGRVRAYYLVGSYADGSAVPQSDVDLRAVFRGGFQGSAEEEQFREVRQHCRQISSVGIDLPPLSEARLLDEEAWIHETISIRSASRFLYGEDIRERLPAPDVAAYTRNVTGAPILFLPVLHGSRRPLHAPLTYPDPDDEFFGFTVTRGTEAPSTKMLVHAVGFAATALLAMKAGQIVTKKSDWLPLYRAHLNDEGTPFLTAIYNRCRQEWAYQLPASQVDRGALRELCRRSLAFENHYLACYRDYLLDHLRSERREHRLFALRRLKDVVYPEMLPALENAETGDDELRQAVDAVMQAYQENGYDAAFRQPT